MERASPTVALDFYFRLTSLGQRGVGGDSDESVQLWIKPFYALQTFMGQFDW
jgi:hypothetical protein